MATYKVVDFQDIIDAVREDLKVQPGDTVSINKIKRVINQIYLQEVVPFSRWKWLEGTTTVVHKARYNAGTVSVEPNNATVTLSTAPPASQGSFAGKLFAVDGFNEVYVIAEHVAESTTLTLATDYQGNATTEGSFKIWTNELPLPDDCRETVSIYHNFSMKPMTGVGKQRFRELSQLNPRQEAYPVYYYTADFADPTPLTPETESDRYRKLLVHPAIINTNCTLQIDYVKEVSALDDSGDEPAMPVEDRIVLVHGALARLWKTMASDNDNAVLSKQDYESKLARMAGKIEDSQDTARVAPTSTYVRSMRAPRNRPGSHTAPGITGGGGYNQIQFLEDVTIKGANLIANMTVANGVTIDGVDVSELSNEVDTIAFDLSEHIAQGTDAHDASAISVVPAGNVTSTDAQAAIIEVDASLTAHIDETTDAHDASAISVTPTGNVTSTDVQSAIAELDSDLTAASNLTNGKIWIGNGSNVRAEVTVSGDITLSNSGVADITAGAIVNADISAGAGIARSKLAALTADRVLVSDVSGNDSASAITSTELTYLDDVLPLTTATLTDNMYAPVTGLTHVAANYPIISLHYSISRGSGNIECGIINIVNDGSQAAIAQGAVASLGSVGVTFTPVISGSDVILYYQTTNTGVNATMKYKLHKWA